MRTGHDAPQGDSAQHDSLGRFVAQWVDAFNRQDHTALDGLYEPDGVVVPVAGQPVSGPARSAALAYLLSMKVPMVAYLRHSYVSGDIALLVIDWVLSGTTPDGRSVDMRSTATDVVRRGSDGSWRYVIDNPSGIS